MSSSSSAAVRPAPRTTLLRVLDLLSVPALALFTAFAVGAILIWITSWLSSRNIIGSLNTVFQAYAGLVQGAFFKQRGLSETLVASVPYILLGLGVAVGFKAGLFNIGVEGQFYIGAISAAWAGQAFHGLPAIIHLPLTLLAGMLGGAIWAAIPGYLKARTGAHEVINTIMMNYIAFRLAEFVVSGPLRDRLATAVQTTRVAPEAELWSFWAVPERLQNSLNALGVALLLAFVAWFIVRWWRGRRIPRDQGPNAKASFVARHAPLVVAAGVGILSFFGLPALTRIWWPFTDQYDRLHVGLILAILAAVAVWWLLWKTTIGFELRMAGANPNAARYAGVNITRNIVSAMAISGALAGLAGVVEILGVSICRCLPLFFSSGYGFDSIAIALLANNNPFGIVAGSFLFGAMRNGQDLMELNSGVSKYIISVIQALVLLFVAAPPVVRWIYRMKEKPRTEVEAPLARGWGG
jgi:general nucleoside transport system permease protein